MASERKWKKSTIDLETVNQNTENAKKYIELTEKYKETTYKLHTDLNSVFKALKEGAFTKFDPNSTLKEDFQNLNAEVKSLITQGIKDYLADEAFTNAENKAFTFETRYPKEVYDEGVRHYTNKIKSDTYLWEPLAEFTNSNRKEFLQFIFLDKDIFNQAYEKIIQKAWANEQLQQWKEHLEQSSAPSITYLNKLFGFENESTVKNMFLNIRGLYSRGGESSDMDRPFVHKFYGKYLNYLEAKANITDEIVAALLNKNFDNLEFLKKLNIQGAEEWINHLEIKQSFLKQTEEMHDDYNTILELDDRDAAAASKESATDSIKKPVENAINSILSTLKGHMPDWMKGYTKTTQPAPEKADEDCSLFGLWCTKKTNKDTSKDTNSSENKSSSSETVVASEDNSISQYNPNENKDLTVVKKVDVESRDSVDQVHDRYQSMTSTLVDLAKGACFSEALHVQKVFSSCLIRKPFEDVTQAEKLNCTTYEIAARNAIKQCDFIFPFGTNSDELISKYLNQSSKVEAEIYSDGQIGLITHTDRSVGDLGMALGKEIYHAYMALPAGTSADTLTAAYGSEVNVNGNVISTERQEEIVVPMLQATQDSNLVAGNTLPAPESH